MRCPKPEDLHAYADEDLPTDESAEIAAHLDGCEGCSSSVEEMGATRQAWRRVALSVAARLADHAPTGNPASHLTDDDFAAYLSGSLDEGATTKTRDHLINCADCLREAVLTARLHEGLEGEDASQVQAAVSEILAPAPPSPASDGAAIALASGAGSAVIEALRLAWELTMPVLRPMNQSVPAMAADQLVETRATPDGALQISVEVKLPDEGLAEGSNVPIVIHALASADRPELADQSLACRLREGSEVVYEGVLKLRGRRGSLEASVPRPKAALYDIDVEPIDPNAPP